jgi:hypothetical protein
MSVSALSPLPPTEPTPRSDEFEADLARLREVMLTWATTSLVYRPIQLILRRPYYQVVTTAQRVLVVVLSFFVRFLVPVVVTTATASWAGAPLGTWLGIAVFLAALDVYGTRVGSASSLERTVAMPAVIDRDEDLHQLVEFTRRWCRLRAYAPAAVAIALVVLGATAVVAPDEFRTLHPGSLALLALLLYEYGESASMRFIFFMLYVRESRYRHRLSWLSPFDSQPVQSFLSIWRQAAIGGSVMMSMSFVLAVILIAPASVTVLLAPVAGFTLVTVVLDMASVMSVRTSVQRIVRHTRDATLDRLRHRIDSFEPRLEDLRPQETEQLQGLIATYAAVRDAPTGPSGAQTFGHAVTALAIPALAFFLAVMSEVYAERLLNQVLP